MEKFPLLKKRRGNYCLKNSVSTTALTLCSETCALSIVLLLLFQQEKCNCSDYHDCSEYYGNCS
ncbi:MAG TPA: hypothetical protein PK521_12735, partial [Bacteroidales bacterium]|nr:hypothetical protein [Bacteroidales bacterium]